LFQQWKQLGVDLQRARNEVDYADRVFAETKQLEALHEKQKREIRVAEVLIQRREALEQLRCMARRFGINDFGFSGGPSAKMSRWVQTGPERPKRQKPRSVVISRTIRMS
jgi:hypothetical protein